VARVFVQKMEQLLKDVRCVSVCGKVAGMVYTVEFQKKGGLPHMHLLIFLQQPDKIRNPKDVMI